MALVIDKTESHQLNLKLVRIIGRLYTFNTVEPRLADTRDITDNSECPDCISIDFNTFKPPQQRTLRYSV